MKTPQIDLPHLINIPNHSKSPCKNNSHKNTPRHGLVVFAALTPPPKVAKAAATSTVTATPVTAPPAAPEPVTAPAAPVAPEAPVAVPVAPGVPGTFRLDQRVMFRGQGGTVRYIGETNVGVGDSYLQDFFCSGLWYVSCFKRREEIHDKK